MKLTKEISYANVESMLIAAYYTGWDTGRLGYDFTSEKVSEELQKLSALLTKETK